jgi:hypothetical protein
MKIATQSEMKYENFLQAKRQANCGAGFDPISLPDFLFDFQSHLTSWAIRQGRGALFCDCGMGKTPMQLVWADNVVRKTNGRVLILTPLAVAFQTVAEGEKFHIECYRSEDGRFPHDKKIIVANYERLEKFDSEEFSGCVCDESSILKSFDGTRRKQITEFMRCLPYRLLCTATAAPNDYTELGTSSEALGYPGHIDMLNRFFKNDKNNSSVRRAYGKQVEWRLKGHAEEPFWRWVCSWARALRKPSDFGFEDGDFILPELIENQHIVKAKKLPDGKLFDIPAVGLYEQREERRRTIAERCERVADIVGKKDQALVWCHLNPEGDLLEKLIPGAVQVSGSDSEQKKEEAMIGFAQGRVRVLVTKPKIGAWGLNFQSCHRVTFFPSHSFEQYYQGVRRCWRFGQRHPVIVDVVTTEGERQVMDNMSRKAAASDEMFSRIVQMMRDELNIGRDESFGLQERVPTWL